MAEKVTVMVLKVDLQCPCCYKKVKRILCKFPQIRDQVYDEKSNTVTIHVICCNPEKFRDKLCCKGGKTIKCIEIKEPPKPKPPEKKEPPPEKPKPPPEKPKPPPEKPPQEVVCVPPSKPDPPKPPPKKPEPPPKAPEPCLVPVWCPPGYPGGACCGSCYEGRSGGPCYHGHGPKEPKPQPKQPEPAPKPCLVPVWCPPGYPGGACCGSCYEGRTGGPCYHGHGRPEPPPPCYEGYGRPIYDTCGRPPCHVSRCDYYFSEENPSGCTIM